MARSWYSYKGPNSPTELPGSYSIATGVPACTDGNELCAIYAKDGGATPIYITSNLQLYISNALIKLVAQPDFPINSRLFVVLKNPS